MLVKRYPNRKLYDTEARKYISLSTLGDYIRQGREVQVVEHPGGEDITARVLSQIILEREKEQRGSLPAEILRELVHAGGYTLVSLGHALDPRLDQEIEERIQYLLEWGELSDEQAEWMREKLLRSRPAPALPGWLGEEDIERVLHRLGIPTRGDIESLSKQIDALEANLAERNNPRVE